MSEPMKKNELSQIVHKINNPLAIIACKVECLSIQVQNKSIDESKITKDLEIIHNMTFQISELLNQLKDNPELFLQSNHNGLLEAET